MDIPRPLVRQLWTTARSPGKVEPFSPEIDDTLHELPLVYWSTSGALMEVSLIPDDRDRLQISLNDPVPVYVNGHFSLHTSSTDIAARPHTIYQDRASQTVLDYRTTNVSPTAAKPRGLKGWVLDGCNRDPLASAPCRSNLPSTRWRTGRIGAEASS